MVWIDDIETTNTALNILKKPKKIFSFPGDMNGGYLHHTSFIILVNIVCVDVLE